MALSEKQIIANIKAGQFSPVYLLTGEEGYYIDLLSDFFEKEFIPEENRDFDQTVVYGSDLSMAQVINLARQVPIISPRRLVLVKEAQNIKKNEWDLMVNYMESPSPLTVLVLCYRHSSFDKRTKAYKSIDKSGIVYEHKKMQDYEIPAWILGQVVAAGYQITERGALLMSEALGSDLAKISNELSKLYIILPPGSTITEDVLEVNIGISKDYNIFELQSAIGRRDIAKCNRIVNHFAANPKENPIIRNISLLYKFFVGLMVYIQNVNTLSQQELARAVGCSTFFLKDYAVASRNYSLGKLASCIEYLHEADLRSKGVRNSGSVTEGELMKELIFKVIH